MSVSTSVPTYISNFDFYDDLEFEHTCQILIHTSKSKQKKPVLNFGY